MAPLDAGRRSADLLRALMQNRNYTTTQGYIVPGLGNPPKSAGG